jgi:hypothetical protein
VSGAIGVPATDEAIERALAEIFADPAYGKGFAEVAPPATVVTFLSELADGIFAYLRSIFESMHDLQFESPAVFWTIFVGLCLVLALLLVHIGWTVRFALTAAAPRRAVEAGEAAGVERARELLRRAAQEAGDGAYGDALRLLFLALLAVLHERRYETPDGWTNHEIVKALGVPADVRGRLAAVAAAFDASWYGRQELAREGYEACRETIQGVMEAARGERPPSGGP